MQLKNKNILIILHYGTLGGAQRQALGLAKYLSKERDCTVDLFLMHSDFQTKEFKDYVQESGIRNTYHFGEPYLYLPKEWSLKNIKRLRWNYKYLNKLRKGLKPYNYSLVIPYLNHTSKLAYFIYKMIPSVKFTFWHQLGLDIIKKDWIEELVRKNIPCVIGNAPNCYDIFEDELPIPKSKFHLLPQYLTLDVVKLDKQKKRKELNIPQDAIVVGMIAHYRKDKYFDLLFDAFLNIKKKMNLKVYLVLLGNKDNDAASFKIYENLKRRVKQNNLQHSVSVVSNLEVIDVLNVLDIAVLVSQIEGMPNSVMEYMAYGIPSVVSNHPGCKQLLENSEYLIPNNQSILEEKLNKLICNKEEREIEGCLNLERIKKFNLPSYVDSLENIMSKYI
ncbi:glycosyltransferase family 4 protein [Polaribacter sp. IC073]|uniref:glycosyltransferase family 4 protein n=1 Tax=Polaribacter sp. IC073 TaxID=2508540 RepID=UPI0011BE44D1|nr:glycosyltransferase family 4 protein [Polaribacter sp. IC073]TXD49115.1 glycosyltransferase family 4 protein [Polaribacter sp. IC073]